jgi:Cof subfamily protein (haloacid dehalogenase superfamily)
MSAPSGIARERRRAAKVSLVIADVDGTLVTEDKRLTPRARDAVSALKAAGIGFSITSGRPPRGMSMLIEPLALVSPFAGFNGGVFAAPDLAVIERRLLDAGTARRAAALLEESGLDVWVYDAQQWLVRNPDAPHVSREAWTVRFPPAVVGDLDTALAHAVKIVGVSDDHERVARAEHLLRDALGDGASAARSQPYYLDVTNPAANKGAVVRTLSRLLSVPPEEIATIGDMPNDILMFRESGLGIAMGNAGAEVKAEADLVTDDNEAEGFAKAIERFVLGRAEAVR